MHRLFLAILEWNFLPQNTSPESAWLLLCLSIEEVLEAQCLQRRRGRSRSRPFVPYGSETQPWRCAFLYKANQFASSVSVCVCVFTVWYIAQCSSLYLHSKFCSNDLRWHTPVSSWNNYFFTQNWIYSHYRVVNLVAWLNVVSENIFMKQAGR